MLAMTSSSPRGEVLQRQLYGRKGVAQRCEEQQRPAAEPSVQVIWTKRLSAFIEHTFMIIYAFTTSLHLYIFYSMIYVIGFLEIYGCLGHSTQPCELGSFRSSALPPEEVQGASTKTLAFFAGEEFHTNLRRI